MKNLILVTSILLLSFSSCKKDGNKGVLEKETTENATSENNTLFDETLSYGYIAEDGSRATVTYQNDKNANTITLNSNNVRYVLDKKDADADAQIYERSGVMVTITKDSLFIAQDDIYIPMALVN